MVGGAFSNVSDLAKMIIYPAVKPSSFVNIWKCKKGCPGNFLPYMADPDTPAGSCGVHTAVHGHGQGAFYGADRDTEFTLGVFTIQQERTYDRHGQIKKPDMVFNDPF